MTLENDEHIKIIIREAVSTAVNEAVSTAVKETLLNIGLDADDKLRTQAHMIAIREVADMMHNPEYQADLAHLRKWRRSVEQVSTVGIKTAVGVIITGAFGFIIFLIQEWLTKR